MDKDTTTNCWRKHIAGSVRAIQSIGLEKDKPGWVCNSHDPSAKLFDIVRFWKVETSDALAPSVSVLVNPRPAGVFGRTRPAGGGADSAPLPNSRTDSRRKTGKNGKRKLSTRRILRTPNILLNPAGPGGRVIPTTAAREGAFFVPLHCLTP